MGFSCFIHGHDWHVTKILEPNMFGYQTTIYTCKRYFTKHQEREYVKRNNG
jgi:hypothetical protein